MSAGRPEDPSDFATDYALRAEIRRAEAAKTKAEEQLKQRDDTIEKGIHAWAKLAEQFGNFARLGCAIFVLLVLAGGLGAVVGIWRVALKLGR